MIFLPSPGSALGLIQDREAVPGLRHGEGRDDSLSWAIEGHLRRGVASGHSASSTGTVCRDHTCEGISLEYSRD
jgi:hypothetical protein